MFGYLSSSWKSRRKQKRHIHHPHGTIGSRVIHVAVPYGALAVLFVLLDPG
jgi:hypothetical protein